MSSLLYETILFSEKDGKSFPIHIGDAGKALRILAYTAPDFERLPVWREEFRVQVRESIRQRLTTHTHRTRQDRRCEAGGHVYYDYYQDGRDLSCRCANCGAWEV